MAGANSIIGRLAIVINVREDLELIEIGGMTHPVSGAENQPDDTIESDSRPAKIITAPDETDPTAGGAFDRVALVFIVVALIVLTVQWIAVTRQKPEPLDWERDDDFARWFQVDINTAGWVEWIQLDGIGHKTAHQIVLDRERSGPFSTIGDLQRVHGIGPATLDAIRPWLTISHDAEHSSDEIGN